MKEYLKLGRRILNLGTYSSDRTGTGTMYVFGEYIRFDMRNTFPAVTTKKLAWKSVVAELLWFLKGSNNVNDLRAIQYGEDNRFNPLKRTIWDANYEAQGRALGYAEGRLGPIYGVQWRGDFVGGVDQISNLLERAASTPDCRRLMVSAWNPAMIDKMALPPCHYGFQVNIDGDYIDLLWTQRSVDYFLGLPFNIASYALLAAIFGRILGKTPRSLVGQLGNTHIYQNHQAQVLEQLQREPFPEPTLWINPELKTLEDFELRATVDDFKLIGYEHHPALTGAMAV